ncbi:MAG: fumarate hydratase [Candidatus Omnitrophota bacterium]|nr:fumarate hydratase [Candidatus Omnitrophota bacterium]
MRKIKVSVIKKEIEKLCVKANFDLRSDVLKALRRALKNETNRRAKELLSAIIKNSQLARRNRLAICQDTGMPMVFLEIGQNVNVAGGNLIKTIQQAVAGVYRQAGLRNSIIADPLKRGRPQFSPVVIHTEIISGDKIKLTILPKGFGCENKSQLKMLLPTAGLAEIKKFIIEAVKIAGPDACPPFVVGVGIGGTADYASLLAKKALLRKIKNPCLAGRQEKSKIKNTNQNSKICGLEKELLSEINRLNIGPMGLGGKTTCLGVNIETYPTHIAGLPVAINISCHALRSARKVI